MELALRNITIFKSRTLKFPDKNKVFIYTNISATGKTTIAKIMYSFATGRVDTSLKSVSAEEGEAILTLGSRQYRLLISDQGTRVERVLQAPWSGFLVMTEGTELYPVYISPPSELSIDPYLNDIVPPPKELAQMPPVDLPSELQQIEKQLLQYQTSLHSKEKALREVEEQLRKLNKVSTKVVNVNLAPYYRVKELQSKIEATRRKIDELSSRIAALEASIDRNEYSRLKRLHNKYELELMNLRRELDRYARLREALEKIREGLKELAGYLDLDIAHKIVICSQLITEEFLNSSINDVEASIYVVQERIEDINSRIGSLEAEKTDVDAKLQKITRMFIEYETLTRQVNMLKNQLQRYQEQLRNARIQLTNLLKKLGLASVEELEKLLQENQRMAELLRLREQLEERRQRLSADINSIHEAMRALEERRRQLLEKEEEFSRLKRAIAEKRRKYTERVALVREYFRESLYYFLSHFKIPDFNIEALKLLRPSKTYSQAERFIIAVGMQYALLSILLRLGYTVPFVVIDILAPIDTNKERRIIELFKGLVKDRNTQVVFLKTSDEEKLVTVL